MEGTEQLRRIACPPCKIEGLPKEIFVRPRTATEHDQVCRADSEKGRFTAYLTMIALRARSADGVLLYGRGILPQWTSQPGAVPMMWAAEVADAIAHFDIEWEEEQRNL